VKLELARMVDFKWKTNSFWRVAI